MDDLITKFFQEDLSEAEEKALGESLSSSVEDALRFGQHAETAYYHYGLPEPEWPGDASNSPGLKLKHWIWLGVALAGASSWTIWNHFSESSPISPKVSIASESPKVSDPQKQKNNFRPGIQSQDELSTFSGDEKKKPSSLMEKERSQSTVTMGLSEMKPVLTPVDLAAQPHRAHTNLSVVLRRTTPGKVTLRVLNSEGTQTVLLYNGLLPAGNWSFDWDGMLGNGQKPPPGRYKIRVESGSGSREKNINIR